MSLAADIMEALQDSELLVTATHSPARGGADTVFQGRLMKGAAGLALLSAQEPGLQFAAADVPEIEQGDTVAIDGTAYTVRDRVEEACSADGAVLAYRLREAA